MEYGTPLQPDSFVPDFTDDTIADFDNVEAVAVGLRRKYEDVEYESFTNIYALAFYSWNEYDENSIGITTRLSDKVDITSTAVPCIQNETIVYVEDSYKDTASPQEAVGKYFKYTGTTGNVDFTTVDVSNPANFTEVINYRYFDAIPDEESIYWKTIETLNTYRLIDGKIYTKTVSPDSVMVYDFYFTTYINAIAIFNMSCEEINITVNAWEDGTSDYTNEVFNETTNLLDLTGITSSYAWHYTPLEKYKNRLLARIPIYPKVKITITFTNTATNPEVGEVIFARTESSGITLDKPTGVKKNFDITTVDKNGNRTVEKSNRIIDTITYRVIIPTNSIDGMIHKWGELINENLLIIGDETGAFTVLINYAYIKDIPYEISSNSEQNIYSLTANTLI